MDNIQLISRNVELSDQDKDLALQRCERVIKRYARSVNHVTIRLEDINGPRGGVNKQASISARLRNGDVIHAHKLSDKSGTALGRALDVLKSQLQKTYGSRKGGILMAA